MTLPGFQASASLYKTTNVYRAGAYQGGNATRGASPQFRWYPGPIPGPLPIAPPVWPQPQCPLPWEIKCGGRCTDPLIDFYNCGSCGHFCQPNETCLNGTCMCLYPYHYCEALGGTGKKCVSNRYECF
jgi:hypothetical protein